MRTLAQELVRLQPDIILANSLPATFALQRETQIIPIVFVNVSDPVATGIVARLDRPSGKITGFATFEPTLGGKWLELLSEVAPRLKRAAIMFNPDIPPASVYVPSVETAARLLKVVPTIAPVRSDVEIETAIIALGREPGGGLVVLPDEFTGAHRAPIISAAAQNKVPAVYWRSIFARDGGLLSYGFNSVDLFRRAATYVDRILRGATGQVAPRRGGVGCRRNRGWLTRAPLPVGPTDGRALRQGRGQSFARRLMSPPRPLRSSSPPARGQTGRVAQCPLNDYQ
jgi:putative ABC transport system substrate-binding protein